MSGGVSVRAPSVEKPAQYAKKWRDAIPWYLEGVDDQMVSRWSEIRNGIIEAGKESRRALITIDTLILWDVEEIAQGKIRRAQAASSARVSHTPEVRVLIEQAQQYRRFRQMAEDARMRLQIYQTRLADPELPPESRDRTLEVMEKCSQALLNVELQAAKQLADLRDTTHKFKDLAVKTIKHSDSALESLAKISQSLILAKEKMEMERDRGDKPVEEMTDAELIAMTQAASDPQPIPQIVPDDEQDEDPERG